MKSSKPLFLLMCALLFSPLLSAYFGFPDIPPVKASWLTGWGYRKSLTLGGSTDGDLTDFLIEIVVHRSTGTDSGKNVYVGNNCENDFSDIRFTTSDETTQLDYHRVSYTSGVSGTFMVEVNSISASPATTKIYLYYGNSGASTTSSTGVYMLYEDFSSGISSWSGSGDAFSVSAGKLITPHADEDYDYLYKEFTKKSNSKVKVKFTFRSNYEKSISGGWRPRAPCIALVHGTATDFTQDSIRIQYRNIDNVKYWRGDLFEGGAGHTSEQTYAWSEDTWITTTAEYDGSTLTVNNDDGGTTRTVNNVQTTTWKYFAIKNRRSQGWIDDIKIWEIASDMPSYDGWGSQESDSDPAPINESIGYNETRMDEPCHITGSYQQVANISLSGQLDWANSTQTLPTNRSSINYRFNTYNTDGSNTTASDTLTLTASPVPSNLSIGYNATEKNEPCLFYSYWNQTGSANLTYSILHHGFLSAGC